MKFFIRFYTGFQLPFEIYDKMSLIIKFENKQDGYTSLTC